MEQKKQEEGKVRVEKEARQEKKRRFVTRDMLIGDVVQRYPKAAFVMLQYGLHCVGCPVAAHESVEQGSLGHGMPDEVIEEMLDEINTLLAEEEATNAGTTPSSSSTQQDPKKE